MNILFVVPYVPSLVRVRPYNLIRHLTARGHHVIVLTLWTSAQERAELEALKAHCDQVRGVRLPTWQSLWNCVRALPSATPLQAVYCWSAQLASLIAQLRSQADVVHVEHLRGAHYGLAAQAANHHPTPPVIWDSVDCISHLFEQAARESRNHFGKLVTRLELSRTRHHEGQLLHRFDHVLITSGIDREALLQLGRANGKRLPAARPDGARRPSNGARLARDLTVLPNGVDVTYFKPGDGSRASSTLVFSGKMSYHANVTMALHLAQDIMPRVWARRPEVKLQVVGKNPPRQVLALAAHPAVEVTGMVPDVRPYLQQATLAVAPATYGAGIQNKVLEAMACATPVVASAQAVSALRVKAGEDVLVASEPEAFSDAVVQLLDEPHRQRQLGQAGRRFVEAHHQWDHIVAQLEDVYHGVIRTRG